MRLSDCATHAPFRSGIDIEDHQLDPAVRAIQMPQVSLLIADDVGLGKIIEAGLVALTHPASLGQSPGVRLADSESDPDRRDAVCDGRHMEGRTA